MFSKPQALFDSSQVNWLTKIMSISVFSTWLHGIRIFTVKGIEKKELIPSHSHRLPPRPTEVSYRKPPWVPENSKDNEDRSFSLGKVDHDGGNMQSSRSDRSWPGPSEALRFCWWFQRKYTCLKTSLESPKMGLEEDSPIVHGHFGFRFSFFKGALGVYLQHMNILVKLWVSTRLEEGNRNL